MMREILFKAKRVEDGEWVEGYPVLADGDNCIYEFSEDEHGSGWNVYEVDPETLCQYTGLNDKNGDRIFEGDMLSGTLSDRVFAAKTEKVVPAEFIVSIQNGHWSGYYTQWETISEQPERYQHKCNVDEMEITGNIHD